MKTPNWFWAAMGVWLVIGLPSYALGSLWKGSLIPDPPPIFWATNVTDQTLGTLAWLLTLPVAFMPVFAIPALILWRRKMRRRSNAAD